MGLRHIVGETVHDGVIQKRMQAAFLAVKIAIEGFAGNTCVLADLSNGDGIVGIFHHQLQQTLLQLPLTPGAVFGVAVLIHIDHHLPKFHRRYYSGFLRICQYTQTFNGKISWMGYKFQNLSLAEQEGKVYNMFISCGSMFMGP